MEQIKQHLEFLGYEVRATKEQLTARHTRRWNCFVRPAWQGVTVGAIFATSDYAKENPGEFFEFLNRLNCSAEVTRFFADRELTMVMEAWWPAVYERVPFGRFLDYWDADTRRRFPQEGMERFMKSARTLAPAEQEPAGAEPKRGEELS
jgi:hypothetical protein